MQGLSLMPKSCRVNESASLDSNTMVIVIYPLMSRSVSRSPSRVVEVQFPARRFA